MTVFVDTGILFAATAARDRSHGRAVAVLERVADEPTVTTDHVIVEAWSLLEARYGRHHAMRFWHGLGATPLRVEAATVSDLERALMVAETWPDQDFDIVDCTSFVVMERLGCRRAATFDSDFAVYRYGPDRKHAFEIVS